MTYLQIVYRRRCADCSKPYNHRERTMHEECCEACERTRIIDASVERIHALIRARAKVERTGAQG